MKINIPENERAVLILKDKGSLTLQELAEEMQITTEGARFQLIKLAKEGLVNSTTVSKGRGRPQQIWSLTALGNTRFPDAHAELTVKLIQKIRQTLGESALDTVIEANGKEGLEKYARELEGVKELEERISGLADIRDREGYMASYSRYENGFLLVENHCPICAAASTCQGFCKSELSTFQALLGDRVKIERTSHILSGARRCAYFISSVETVSDSI